MVPMHSLLLAHLLCFQHLGLPFKASFGRVQCLSGSAPQYLGVCHVVCLFVTLQCPFVCILHCSCKSVFVFCMLENMPQRLRFQVGSDLWLVFQDEGPSFHSLMYSAKAMPATSTAQTPTAAAQRPTAAAQRPGAAAQKDAAQRPTAVAPELAMQQRDAASQQQLGCIQSQQSQEAPEQGSGMPAADPSATEDSPQESQVRPEQAQKIGA